MSTKVGNSTTDNMVDGKHNPKHSNEQNVVDKCKETS